MYSQYQEEMLRKAWVEGLLWYSVMDEDTTQQDIKQCCSSKVAFPSSQKCLSSFHVVSW